MGPNRSCGVVIGPERIDDPLPTHEVAEMGAEFERMLASVLHAGDLVHAKERIEDFVVWAHQIATSPFEVNYVRRLELSATLTAFCMFEGDVDEAALIAAELIRLPCHRRIAQVWEVVVFAGFCRKRGRPEVGWQPLLGAFELADRELPSDENWLARRAYFLGVLHSLWSSIGENVRHSLTPLPANER